MKKDPYKTMRDVPPMPKGKSFTQHVYRSHLLACEKEFGGWAWVPRTPKPTRAKALLRRVTREYYGYVKYTGEQELRYYENYQPAPIFDLDGLTLIFVQGEVPVEDYFLASLDVGDLVLALEIRSFEQLGFALAEIGELTLMNMEEGIEICEDGYFDMEYDKLPASVQLLLDDIQDARQARLADKPPSFYFSDVAGK